MDPRNESQAFSFSCNVLQGVTPLLFVFLSFPFGVTNKRALLLSIFSVFSSVVDTFVQRYDVHGS